MNTLPLISLQGQRTLYAMSGRSIAPVALHPFNRIAYSAAHVVADPRAAIDPWLQSAVDWDATLQYRHHL